MAAVIMKKFRKYEVFIVLLLGVLRLTAKKLSVFLELFNLESGMPVR